MLVFFRPCKKNTYFVQNVQFSELGTLMFKGLSALFLSNGSQFWNITTIQAAQYLISSLATVILSEFSQKILVV